MKRNLPGILCCVLILGACQTLPELTIDSLPAEPASTGLPAVPSGMVTGTVLDKNGPVADALVRVKTTANQTLTDEQGEFHLEGLPPEDPVTITAWKEGYFVGWKDDVLNPQEEIIIELKPYYTYDNPDYDWFSAEGEDGSLSCSHCMPCYEEWDRDAHSKSAVNERFLSMYNGTDLSGNQSPLTRFTHTSDYGFLPLKPDPNQPYFGPGYKLDFPETGGNCAACHVPAQAAHPGREYQADPNLASGIELEGVFCEFCHKIGDITLNPETGLPYDNMPGVLSYQLHRPEGEDQIFFGNFDDVTRRVSKLPLESESEFCAACHYGVFWDVVIYNSYGEWLESSYSDPESGQTCQECHMSPVDYDYFVYPEQGGFVRDHGVIRSHYMPGAADQEFLQDAADLQAKLVWEGDQIKVTVRVENDNTGHNLPTDSPLRQVLLVVQAFDGEGNQLVLLDGPLLPAWAGEGDEIDGYYAGQPGLGYALILREEWTGISPTGNYWNPVEIVEDSRLKPFEPDHSQYVFDAANSENVEVRVQLWYRRAFKELMDQKGWTDADILMGEVVIGNVGD